MLKLSDMITKEQLENLLLSYESSELEFKSAKGGFPGSFWETYSSFANTQGGCVVLGVKQTDDGFKVDGLDKSTIEQRKKSLWDGLNDRRKVSANILTEKDASEYETPEGYILLIEIPKADFKKRPVFIDNNPENSYKREHEGDYKCTDSEIRRMYAESNIIECPIDSKILPDFSFEKDLDLDAFYKYRQEFSNLHRSHPWSSVSDWEFLVKLGGAREDRKTKEKGLTLAGMLMFGKYYSITDPYCCPSFFPDYREKDPATDRRWTDRVYFDGTWEVNLYNFYNRVYNKLTASIPKPFALKDGVRIEDSPMHIAIREAFVNCLIHCDYTQDSTLTVINEGTRFVFTNPGSMLVSMSQYRLGGESVCRNKALQTMFTFIGAAEKAGSGADKIWKGWKASNFRNPFLHQRDNKVILELPFVSMLSKEVVEKLKEIYGSDVTSIGHNKLLVLAACANEGQVSNATLQNVLDMHPSDITVLLKDMVSEGKLLPSGMGKGTKYQLVEKKNTTSRISKNDTTSEDFQPTLFSELEVSGDEVEGSSISENTTSSISGNTSSRKRNRSTLALHAKILDFCSDFKSLSEISEHVNRSVAHLKVHVIPELLESGKLQRKYPETPNHPDQKYKIVR